MRGFDFEDVAIAGPDVEAATDAAVGADGFSALVALMAHFGFYFRERENGRVAGGGLDALDGVDHIVQDFGRQRGEIAGVADHALFHERIAGADGDAVAAADAAGAFNGLAAVPHDAGHFAFPADGECLVDLDVLAGLHAAAAEDALAGVVAVKGVGVVLLVAFFAVFADLVLHVELGGGVVDGAVAVVVVADRAVQVVVFEDAIKGLAFGDVGAVGVGENLLADGHGGAAGADQLAVEFDHAGVAAADGSHGGQIADLRDAGDAFDRRLAIDGREERLAHLRRDLPAVDVDEGVWNKGDGRIQQRLGVVLGAIHDCLR